MRTSSGTYSTVYHLQFDDSTPYYGLRDVALKRITRECSIPRIMNEVSCLHKLRYVACYSCAREGHAI